ncbi:MAG: HAD-IA family hydrolase [Acidimicrobiales bacterium]|nr:HAD-IA family hydrolase [Acidimicrobiales bacterium]
MRRPRVHFSFGVIVLGVAMLVLSACNARAEVVIEVEEDLSGTVTVDVSLDDAALERVGDLQNQLRTADLVDGGWTVAGPTTLDGLTTVTATKPFASADQLDQVLSEVGFFREFSLTRDRSFAQTEYNLTGTADLTGGVERLGDSRLAQLLGGSPVGIDLDALEADIGPLAEATDLTVRLRMPAEVESDGGEMSPDDADVRVWTMRLDDTSPTVIDASATQSFLGPRLWMLLAGVFVVLTVASVLYLLFRRLTDPPAPQTEVHAAPLAVPQRPEPVERKLELVVVDGMGVLFRTGDNLGRLLVPFARSRGATLEHEEIAELYRQASMGRLSTAEFWAGCGIDGDAAELNAAYLDQVELSDGAEDFLRRTNESGLRVAVLTNSVNSWVQGLRQRYELDDLIEFWLVSSAIGTRKPDSAAYEALRRTSGVPLHNCLMIDDHVEHLDAARRLGMSTVWFDPPPDAEATDHRTVTDFASFFGKRSTAAANEGAPS